MHPPTSTILWVASQPLRERLDDLQGALLPAWVIRLAVAIVQDQHGHLQAGATSAVSGRSVRSISVWQVSLQGTAPDMKLITLL